VVSNTAVQTSDLASFSGSYLNKSLRKKFNILQKAILVRSGVGFTCNFFHHSYLWGVTLMFIARRWIQCEVWGSYGSENEDCCLWVV